MDKNQNNIASGIVHVTSIFAIGASREIWPKLNTIIGKVKVNEAIVNTNDSLIASTLGKKLNSFVKNHCV